MARNEEKQLARLNRYYLEKQKQEELKKRPPRPRLDTLNTPRDLRKWLPTITRDIEFYVKQMEVTCYTDSKIEEFQDRIQRLKLEYRAYLRKLRALEPDLNAASWANRPYANRKRHTNSDIPQEKGDTDKCEEPAAKPSSSSHQKLPAPFVPLSTPVLHNMPPPLNQYNFEQPAPLVWNANPQTEDQPLDFAPPTALPAICGGSRGESQPLRCGSSHSLSLSLTFTRRTGSQGCHSSGIRMGTEDQPLDFAPPTTLPAICGGRVGGSRGESQPLRFASSRSLSLSFTRQTASQGCHSSGVRVGTEDQPLQYQVGGRVGMEDQPLQFPALQFTPSVLLGDTEVCVDGKDCSSSIARNAEKEEEGKDSEGTLRADGIAPKDSSTQSGTSRVLTPSDGADRANGTDCDTTGPGNTASTAAGNQQLCEADSDTDGSVRKTVLCGTLDADSVNKPARASTCKSVNRRRLGNVAVQATSVPGGLSGGGCAGGVAGQANQSRPVCRDDQVENSAFLVVSSEESGRLAGSNPLNLDYSDSSDEDV
ncbi:hypothetical protein ACOMHN_036413 [Nucella lapillus]